MIIQLKLLRFAAIGKTQVTYNNNRYKGLVSNYVAIKIHHPVFNYVYCIYGNNIKC